MADPVLDTPAPAAPAAAPPEPPSLRETVMQAVEATAPTPTTPAAETPREGETQQQATQRARDEAGRFAKVNKDGSEFPTEAQVKATAEQPEPDPNAEPREEPAPSTDNAPKSWKAAAKERWQTVDPVIRAEVHRREREAGRAIADHAPVKKFVETFSQTIQPFASHYQNSGATPLQIVQNLMQADIHLATAPAPQRAQFMAKLIKDYGIDIGMLDSALAGQDPGNSPGADVDRMLNERLAPINEFVQTEQQRRQAVVQAERSRAVNVLERMAQDNITYPHFDLVAQDMADITEMAFKRKIYLTPQEAYKRAVAMNPEAQAAEQSRSGQQRAQVAHNAATRSLGASLSVSGSPAGLKQTVAPDDLRGTIAAAWEAAQGR